MKYKEYPRTYEKVYTAEDYLNKFNIDRLSTDYAGGKEKYIEKFKSFFNSFDRETWLKIAEFYW